MIPCKDCLILPICQNKRGIVCSLLVNWGAECHFGGKGGKDGWETVHRYLPKVTDIYLDPINKERK